MEYLRHIAVCWPTPRPRLCGVRVRRLTLGHLRIIEALGSPYIIGGSLSTYDAAVVLLVLARPWRRAHRHVARAASFRRAAHALSAIIAQRDAEAACNAVGAHLSAVLWVPDVFESDATPAPSTFAPAIGAAYRIAMRTARLPWRSLTMRRYRSIWDVPVDEALLLLCCADEIDGREFASAAEAGDDHV